MFQHFVLPYVGFGVYGHSDVPDSASKTDSLHVTCAWMVYTAALSLATIP